MNTLVTAYGDKIGSDAYEVILVELSSLIRFVCLSNEFSLMFFSYFLSWWFNQKDDFDLSFSVFRTCT